MPFRLKRSKITVMRQRGLRVEPANGQEGLASIIVVSVLIVIMTLITIGFTRLVNRSAVNSANRQFSASATYAAESGINDVASYLKQYAQNNRGNTLLPKSTSCTGNGSLIGNASSKGPFYYKSQLSSDLSTIYTCLLLNPTPSTLVYNQVQNLKSQIVKINTSASPGALDKVLVSWRPSDSQITGYPTSSNNLNDETTWNSSNGTCKDSSGASASCIPMLRLALFPVSTGESLNSPQAQSKTIFLYPQSGGGTVPNKTYAGLGDGSLMPITCTQNIGGAANFNFSSNTTGYVCNLVISGLSTAITSGSTDSLYMRITPIYNQADVQLAVNDKFGNSLNFINDQAVVDATAQTGGVVKRLQARVDTSSLVNGGGGIDTNVSSDSNGIPEQSVRSANALCKREILTTPSLPGFPAYIYYDVPDSVCHQANPGDFNSPVPTLAFSIVGGDGKDVGKRVCSTGDTPETAAWGCTDASNSDSPNQPATVYIDSGATLSWISTQATSCTASGGWSGEQLASVNGPDRIGSGNTSVSPTTVTEYDLVCSRLGAPNSATKKVTAWPPPTVWFDSTSVTAGQDYSLTWNVANATSCTASGDKGANGAWTGSMSSSKTPGSFTKDLGTWAWNDTSTRTYYITCTDPAGRSITNHIDLGAGITDQPGNPTTPTRNKVNPPSCDDITFTPGADYDWYMSCPSASYLNGGYHVDDLGSTPAFTRAGDISPLSAHTAESHKPLDPGTYCIKLTEWVPGWTSYASPSKTLTPPCFTIYAPLNISLTGQIWNNGPRCSSPGNPWDGKWLCRGGDGSKTTQLPQSSPNCPDGSHEWTSCGLTWSATGGSGSATCQLFSLGYNAQVWIYPMPSSPTPSLGWGDTNGGGGYGPNPNDFILSCTDSAAGQSASQQFNIP